MLFAHSAGYFVSVASGFLTKSARGSTLARLKRCLSVTARRLIPPTNVIETGADNLL